MGDVGSATGLKILTPEYIAAIRAEVDALLPDGVRLHKYWRATRSVGWDGQWFEALHLGVERLGETIAATEALVDMDIAMNDRHPEFLLELHPGYWLDD